MKKIILLAFCVSALFINAQPSFQFAKQVGGKGQSITTDNSGNSYTLGYFAGTVDFDPGLGIFNLTTDNSISGGAFILKLDASGNFIWAKCIDKTQGTAFIALDATNNVYVTGRCENDIIDFDPGPATYTLNGYNGNAFVLKLNSNGDFIWAKQLGDFGSYGIALDIDGSGNVYTIGCFSGTGDFDPGPTTYTLATSSNIFYCTFISKLDLNGNFIWAKYFAPASFNFNEKNQGFGVKVDVTGNVYITGDFSGTTDFDPGPTTYTLNTNTSDIFISKLDLDGNFLWAKQMVSTLTASARSISMDNSSNIYIGGYFSGITGNVSLYSSGNNDALIFKMDPLGNFLWLKNVGGAQNDAAHSIDVDGAGNVYAVGPFSGTADFDPHSGVSNLTSVGAEDVFILKLNTNGNFVGVKQLGGSAADIGTSISVRSTGDLLTTGFFQGVADFDPGPGTYNLTSNTTNCFIYKMSQLAMSVNENNNSVNANIYPNPTNDILNIEFDSKITNAKIEISNTLGQIILIEKLSDKNFRLDLKNFNAGLYFFKIISDNKTITTQKILKQ